MALLLELLLGDCVADEETGDANDIRSAFGEFGATESSVMGMRDTFIQQRFSTYQDHCTRTIQLQLSDVNFLPGRDSFGDQD